MPRSTESSRLVWPPTPGRFSMPLRRQGWHVPCRIVREEDGSWFAEINGEQFAKCADPAHSRQIERIWTSGARISEADYRWLTALREWAVQHDPQHPAANPLRRINPMTLRPLASVAQAEPGGQNNP